MATEAPRRDAAPDLPPALARLLQRLIECLRARAPSLREGVVRTRGAPRYRRLDCDGRALVYLRPRLRGDPGVRLDLSGLWVRPGPSPLEIPGRSGSASLFVGVEADIEEAARFVAAAVDTTRALLEEEARWRIPSIAATQASRRRRRRTSTSRGRPPAARPRSASEPSRPG